MNVSVDKITCMKKECEEAYLTMLKDLAKQIINTSNHTMIKNQVYILLIWMQIIYMVGK